MTRPVAQQAAPQGRPRPDRPARARLWAVVLAGGEGLRLRLLTRSIYGEARPKQYAALLGSRSLLRQTLDRVALTVPPGRTVVVTRAEHLGFVERELGGSPAPHLLVQPEDRGTAAGVLLPAHWVHARDPEATVAVLPSDHFVREEAAFMAHVGEVAAAVERRPEWLVLLGASPTEADTEYGWIEPGKVVGRTATGPVRQVRRFWEKPSAAGARACLARGCLWNTLVCVGRARALIEAARGPLADLHGRLERAATFLGTEHEAWAIRQAYALAPSANFSRTVLEACPEGLMVSPLPTLTWSDLGTPSRVLNTLRLLGLSPPWLEALKLLA